MTDSAVRERLAASLLHPRDDVATALIDLDAGTRVPLAHGKTQLAVTLAEPIAAGHKFAVRAIDKGWRVRKYGEYIGHLTQDVGPGAWVHVHNLATAAIRSESDDAAWRAQSAPHALRDLASAAVPTIAACDGRGRTWRITDDEGESRSRGRLWAEGAAAPVLRDLARPSGVAFRSDGALLVVEAGRATIRAIALDGVRVRETRTVVDAMALPGDLWGLAVDHVDGMWCTLRDAGCLLHYDAEGALLAVLRLPMRDTVACSLISQGEVAVMSQDGNAVAVRVRP